VFREHIEDDLRAGLDHSVKLQLVRHCSPAFRVSTYAAKLSNRRSSALR
jgi:hypothetical protein